MAKINLNLIAVKNIGKGGLAFQFSGRLPASSNFLVLTKSEVDLIIQQLVKRKRKDKKLPGVN